MTRTPEIREMLARVALFRAFNALELDGLAVLCTERVLQKGDVVCRAGDHGDELFVLASGELEVWGAPDGRLLNRLQPGELVGEMSLLLGGPRAATVTVARAANLLVIDKPAFERFFLHNPKVLEHLSRQLARRLATLARGETVIRRTTTITVTGARGLRGKTLVAGSLAAILRRTTGDELALVHLTTRNGRAAGAGLAALAEASEERLLAQVGRHDGRLSAALDVVVNPEERHGALVDDLTRVVAKLGERFAVIVFDCATEGWLRRAVEAVSDVVIEVVDRPRPRPAAGERRSFDVLDLHNPGTSPHVVSHCEPFVLPVAPALADLDPHAQALYVRDHPLEPIGRPLHRLARKLLRTSVGLALGGGAAFGIAHVGVLKVLEDNDVPVDLVAGTSMGSIIGVGYASGIPPDELKKIACRVGTVWTTILTALDPTLVRPAFLSGDRIARVLASVAGTAETFEDLVVPFRAVAADAETGERISIGAGSVAMAYRASAAVPLIWSPIRLDGRILIDGSMVDPVPGEVVREMGADLCIAVNVVPPLRKGVQTVLARWYHRLNRLNPLAYVAGSLGMPSMFDLGMNSIQMLQHELGNYRTMSADVLINPDLAEFTWIELYRAAELIERGAEAAERALPQLRQLIADRVAARGYGATAARPAAPPLVLGRPPDAVRGGRPREQAG